MVYRYLPPYPNNYNTLSVNIWELMCSIKHGILNNYFCLGTLEEVITGNPAGEMYLQLLPDTVDLSLTDIMPQQ